MKQRLRLPALAWSNTATISAILTLSLILQGCGLSDDLDSESNRKAMMAEISKSLTNGDCITAITLSTKLYNSKYSDNQIRMLHATAHACITGVRFYPMLQDIMDNDFSTLSGIFKSLVKMFPSRTALDSKLQSGWYAQDALQAIWNPGATIAPADLFFGATYNPGSARITDRTQASSVFLVFVAMGELGTALNRYGFNPNDNPAATAYVKTIPLAWTTKATVQSDTTMAACGIASSLYNLMDALDVSMDILPSNISATMQAVLTMLITNMDTAAQTQCTVVDGQTPTNCTAGIARLRFRNACLEQVPSASAAAGIIGAINAGWI